MCLQKGTNFKHADTKQQQLEQAAVAAAKADSSNSSSNRSVGSDGNRHTTINLPFVNTC